MPSAVGPPTLALTAGEVNKSKNPQPISHSNMSLKCIATIAIFLMVCAADVVRADTDGCINNITNGIEKTLSAAEQIGAAVVNCGAHETAKCVSDISNCAADISAAAADVSSAVVACGGRGSACVTDLLLLGKDLAQTSSEIALAADYCTNSTDVFECVVDVVDIAGTVAKIVESIKEAVTDCRSNATKQALLDAKPQH